MWSGMAGMCRIGGCSISSIGSGVLPGVEKTLDQEHRRQGGQPDADPDRVGPALRDQQAQSPEGHELPEADAPDAPDPALASCDQRGRAAHVAGEPAEVQQRDGAAAADSRSEEHTSELQSQFHLVCRLLLEKKKNIIFPTLLINKKNKT